MRSTLASVLGPALVLVLSGTVLGCVVEPTRGPGRRDAGPALPDAPVPPGVDAPWVFIDGGPRPDRGPLPPADTDLDGLSDEDEAARGTNPLLEDTDGDGQADGVEVLAGTDPLNGASFIPGTDFYVILPYLDPELHRELDFRARLGRADIFFLVDTTGSMGGAIMNVRNSLSTTIVPAVRDAIADVVMGVGDFRDFPIAPYGDPTDWPIRIRQTMTDSVPAVQTALNMLMAGGGADGPESSTQGLFVSVADPCPIPDGGFGAACFRTTSHPIIVHVTDVPFHNGPTPANDYVGVAGARTWSETIAALTANAVRVVGVGVSPLPPGFPFPIPSEAMPDLRALATATGSRDTTGALTVFEAPSGNVSTSVVNGIVDLVGATRQDVTSIRRDDPADAVDATRFITAVTPLRSSRPTTFDATTFYDVPGGTTVTFDVVFQNTFLPPTERPQIFRAYIDVHDLESMTTLDTRNVYVVVPPEGGILF